VFCHIAKKCAQYKGGCSDNLNSIYSECFFEDVYDQKSRGVKAYRILENLITSGYIKKIKKPLRYKLTTKGKDAYMSDREQGMLDRLKKNKTKVPMCFGLFSETCKECKVCSEADLCKFRKELDD
jgi:hypothetical protein